MARSDLLIALIKAGSEGDRSSFRIAAEALIAEERQKQHSILADRLTNVLRANANGASPASPKGNFYATAPTRGTDYLSQRIPVRRLEELSLREEVIHSVYELVEEQRRADLLRAHGLEPRNRVLLVGSPGTGKTSLAEAIAEALAVPLLVVRYEAVVGSFLGETATRLTRVFEQARTTACVLFFDEFDAIAKERGDEHETGEIKRVVSSLLMQIDEVPSYTVVVAATNHPELLDRATWRRFQVRLTLPIPSSRELVAYLEGALSALLKSSRYSATSIAAALGRVSYSEAEEFCLGLLRRTVLAAGNVPVDHIVGNSLERVKNFRPRHSAPKRVT